MKPEDDTSGNFGNVCFDISASQIAIGFILNLENLENLGNRPFCKMSGKTWNSQGVFYNFYPSQGKVRENKVFSLHIIIINY